MNELHISAENALKQIDNEAVLVDIREGFEVENVWINREDILKVPYSEFAHRKEELPKDRTLILCCAAGLVSEIAASQLKTDGYPAVYVLKDGLIGWKKANLPLQTIEEVGFECKCCCKE